MKEARTYAIQCIKDEAEAVLGLIPQLDESFDTAVDLMYHCKGKVIVTGVGKSGHIGAKIAATLSSTGTPSFFINPLDVYHGDLGVMAQEDVVLAISIVAGQILHLPSECECGERGLSTEPGSYQFHHGPTGNGRCPGCGADREA